MTDNLSDILPLTSNTVRLFSLPPSPFERSCICRNSTRCWALIAMSRETQPSGLTRVTLASTSDNQVNSFRGDWPWQHGDLVIGSIWSNWFIWLVGFKLSAGVLRASLQALGREREREWEREREREWERGNEREREGGESRELVGCSGLLTGNSITTASIR